MLQPRLQRLGATSMDAVGGDKCQCHIHQQFLRSLLRLLKTGSLGLRKRLMLLKCGKMKTWLWYEYACPCLPWGHISVMTLVTTRCQYGISPRGHRLQLLLARLSQEEDAPWRLALLACFLLQRYYPTGCISDSFSLRRFPWAHTSSESFSSFSL